MNLGDRVFAPTFDALDDGRRAIARDAATAAIEVLRERCIVAGAVTRADPNLSALIETLAAWVLEATSNGEPRVAPTPTFDALNEPGQDLAFVVTRAGLEAYVAAGNVAPQPAESSAVAMLLEGAAAFVVRAPHEVDAKPPKGPQAAPDRSRSSSRGRSR